MKKKQKTTLIGGFIILGIILLIVAIGFLGSGALFQDETMFVLHFENSVNGLNTGAPVKFRGVKIGTVSKIDITMNDKGDVRIPVYIKVAGEDLSWLLEKDGNGNNSALDDMVHNKGLKARLQMQSVVTGLLQVEFEFLPEKRARFYGSPNPDIKELPTVSSSLEQLSATLEKIPLDQTIDRLLNSIEGIEKFVNAPELSKALTQFESATGNLNSLLKNSDASVTDIKKEIQTTLKETNILIKNTNSHITKLSTTLENTLKNTDTNLTTTADSIKQTANTANKLLTLKEGNAADMVISLKQAAETMTSTMKKAEESLNGINNIIGEDSPIQVELLQTLDQLEKTASSLRMMADYLNRHPEALLQGKQ